MLKSQLPEGWEWKHIWDIAEINYGKGLPKRQRKNEGPVAVYGSNGQVGYHDSATTKGATIVIGRKGSIGEVHLSPESCWPIDTTYFIDKFPKNVFPKYFFYFLKSLDLSDLDRSAAIPGIRRDDIYCIEIPLPPLEEQRRIVARIEELLTRIEQAKSLRQKSLEGISAIMPSTLHEVFSRARQQRWKKSQIQEFADVKGGKRLPKGSPFAEEKTKYPYIRVIDFKNNAIDQSNLCYVSKEIHKRIARYTIGRDDIYISIAGTIGLAGTIPDELDGSNLTENAAKLVLKNGSAVDKHYLAYYLTSPQGQKQIEERSMAAGQPKLALMRIKTIEVPLLPINKQRCIVAYLNSVQQKVNRLKRLQDETSKELESITQSVLSKAFKGEL